MTFVTIFCIDTNECPNKYLYRELYKYLNIFEYSNSFHTHEGMSEYIRTIKFDTNECSSPPHGYIYCMCFLKKDKKNFILRLATLLPGVPLEHSHLTYKHGGNFKTFWHNCRNLGEEQIAENAHF